MNTPQIQEALQKGIRAARRGRKEPAQRLLAQAVQADPTNEEAWLWLSRVVDTPAEKAECLNRVLQINPDNRWAAEQLAELQTGAAESAASTPDVLAPPPVTQPSDIEIEVLQCPNCGSPLELQGKGETQTLVCHYCGSVLDLTAEQAAIVGQMDPAVKPAVPIELGLEGTFYGEAHQVIGWIRYEGWDDEERWQWDEWLLMSARGEFRWLSYDNESGFIFQKKIQPLEAFNPRTATAFQVPGGAAQVIERAQAKVVALAGELTWRATVGDQITYLEAVRGNARYSVEYTNEELEVLSGRQLSAARVWRAFGRDDLAERAERAAAEQQVHWKTVFLVGAIACFVLTLAGCAATVFANASGRQILKERVRLAQGGESSARTVGPVNLQQRNRPYRLRLQSAGEAGSASVAVRVFLRDNRDQEFLITDRPVAPDGRAIFFKPYKTGPFSFKIELAGAGVESIPIIMTVEEGVWLSRYFNLYTLLMGGLLILFAVMWFRERPQGQPPETDDADLPP